MKISTRIDIHAAVHTMLLHQNGILTVIGIDNVVRIYQGEHYKLVNGFKNNVEAAIPYINNLGISEDGKFILFYRASGKELLLFHIPGKKFLHALKAHNAGTECIAFSPDSRAFISGGVDGRIHMWSIPDGRKIDTFPHHSDTVSVIAFSPDARLVATAGYDRIIKVSNRSFRNNRSRLISHKAIPTTLTFLSDQRLLSTDREGSILIWSIVDAKVIKRLEKFPSQITAVALDRDERFLFVCGIQGGIGLYDLREGCTVKLNYLHTLSGITAAAFDDRADRLICGTVDGSVIVYDFAAETQKFETHLEAKAFPECYRMLEANPMLAYTPQAEKLETVFETYYQGARKLLMADRSNEAAALTAPFAGSGAKRLIIQKLFNDFKHYRHFAEAAKSGKFARAYALAESYEKLKTTPLYEAMETQWRKILRSARKLPVDKEYEAQLRRLFKPYFGVPGKNIIMNTMQSDGATVQLFQKLLGSREYTEAFKLIASNPFLKNFDEYRELTGIGEALENRMLETFRNGKYPEAVHICDELAAFPKYSEEAVRMRDRANAYATAMSYYAEKRIAEVYNIIEKHPYLAEAEIGIIVEEAFKKVLNEAERHAASGDVAAVKKSLSRFFKVRSKMPSIVHVIQVAYLGQIEQLCRRNDPSFDGATAQYMRFFGYDGMLDDALSQYEERCEVAAERRSDARKYGGSVEALPDRLV